MKNKKLLGVIIGAVVLIVIIIVAIVFFGGSKDKIANEVAQELKGVWSDEYPLLGKSYITFKSVNGNAGQYEIENKAQHAIGSFGVSMDNKTSGHIDTITQGEYDSSGNLSKKSNPVNQTYYFTYENGILKLYSTEKYEREFTRER